MFDNCKKIVAYCFSSARNYAGLEHEMSVVLLYLF